MELKILDEARGPDFDFIFTMQNPDGRPTCFSNFIFRHFRRQDQSTICILHFR